MPSTWRTSGSATNLTQLNTTSSYTVAFWARQRDFGDVLRHASTANVARDGYAFYFNSSELVARHCNAVGSANYVAINQSPHRDGRWGHYAVVYDGVTNLHGFFNGVLRLRIGNATRVPTANASCTTSIVPGITATFFGNLFDLQILPGVAVPLDNVKLLMNPRYTHPGIKARWFGLGFTGVGPSSTLFDESNNGSNLTTSSTGFCYPDAEPPYLPTLG